MLKSCKLNRNIHNLLFSQAKLSSSSSSNSNKNDSNLPVKPDSKEVLENKYDPKNVTASDMKWRTKWHEEHGHLYNVLRTFYTEDNKRNLLQTLQTEIDLTPSSIKKWWSNKIMERDVMLQAYLPERNRILGNELSAAHFTVSRGGAVKFHNEDKWIKADEYKHYKLPERNDPTKILQGIDCSDMILYYEGLVNYAALQNVEWLSLNGLENIDDWCLDRISNIFSDTLLYLDLRDCPNITERGIGALYKMKKLKILYLDDFMRSTKWELTCLLLQEVNPDLEIQSDEIKF